MIPCKIGPNNEIALYRAEQAFYAPLAPSCWVVVYAPENSQLYHGVTLTVDEAMSWEDSELSVITD